MLFVLSALICSFLTIIVGVRDYGFADDLFDRLDFVLTFVSVLFNYMGPFFLKYACFAFVSEPHLHGYVDKYWMPLTSRLLSLALKPIYMRYSLS